MTSTAYGSPGYREVEENLQRAMARLAELKDGDALARAQQELEHHVQMLELALEAISRQIDEIPATFEKALRKVLADRAVVKEAS